MRKEHGAGHASPREPVSSPSSPLLLPASPQCGRSAVRQAPWGSTPTISPWRWETSGWERHSAATRCGSARVRKGEGMVAGGHVVSCCILLMQGSGPGVLMLYPHDASLVVKCCNVLMSKHAMPHPAQPCLPQRIRMLHRGLTPGPCPAHDWRLAHQQRPPPPQSPGRRGSTRLGS